KELWADWLDQSNTTPATLLAHALAASAEVEKTLEYRPVGPAWLATRGSKRRDGPELIERVG
ncbi:MAG: hypothetical protein LBR21_06125, partial [Propionibacteriaceae bacterium]|nr:hypothetical protein [Propionibacteriaceae bacterium]